jgi:hypothetical protein
VVIENKEAINFAASMLGVQKFKFIQSQPLGRDASAYWLGYIEVPSTKRGSVVSMFTKQGERSRLLLV